VDGGAIISVSAAVVALTQFAKWSGVPDKFGPIAVMLLSVLGTVLWGWSVGDFERAKAFDYFTGWIAVTTSAAGVYGFTRAAAQGISSGTPPPIGGAGSSPTVKGLDK
jgi:hypothetical protein